MKDFFISYNRADRTWAEWIAWQLEEAGYSVVLQAWDFRPGCNFVLEMQKAASEAERKTALACVSYLTPRSPRARCFAPVAGTAEDIAVGEAITDARRIIR